MSRNVLMAIALSTSHGKFSLMGEAAALYDGRGWKKKDLLKCHSTPVTTLCRPLRSCRLLAERQSCSEFLEWAIGKACWP